MTTEWKREGNMLAPAHLRPVKKKKKPAWTHWGRWHRYVRLVTWGDLVNRLLSVNHTACASPHAEVLDVRMKDLTS